MKEYMSQSRIKTNEQGFASLVIAMVLILILSLLTVGFAQFIRREQNNALNKQLSTQAFYAAESAVHDVVKNLAAITTANGDCQHYFTSNGGPLDPQVDLLHTVSYTCVLVDKSPGSISQENVGGGDNGDAWTIQAKTSAASSGGFSIEWTSNSSPARLGAPADTTSKFQPYGTWATNGYMGVLRFSVTPLGAFNRTALTSGTRTYYLYPTNQPSVSGVDYALSGNGSVNPASCQNGKCSITISGLGGTSFLFHVVSIYDASNVSISAPSGIDFQDTQVDIDATGKAQDVLRRIKVVYPLGSNTPLPSNALEAQDICKRIVASPTAGSTYYASLNDATASASTTGICNLSYLAP